VIEASKQFRLLNGHLHLPALRVRSLRMSPRTLSVPCVMMTP
jgi:hypothetical protein